MAFKPFDLTGKTALVTGGNGGIGLGMAEGLVQAGADVVIWGTNPDKNAAALAELQVHGTKVAAMTVDVSSEAEVDEKFAKTLDHLGGRLDACFANAGISSGALRASHFDTTSLEAWRRIQAVNLDGAFLTLRAAARVMRESGRGGSLCVTSSGTSIVGLPRAQSYGASKSGLNGMVLALAVEYGPDGIRANAIIPGWIETGMTEERLALPEFQALRERRIPARRWGTKEDFAAIAVYLASDGSRYHNGDCIVIDGGYTISPF